MYSESVLERNSICGCGFRSRFKKKKIPKKNAWQLYEIKKKKYKKKKDSGFESPPRSGFVGSSPNLKYGWAQVSSEKECVFTCIQAEGEERVEKVIFLLTALTWK